MKIHKVLSVFLSFAIIFSAMCCLPAVMAEESKISPESYKVDFSKYELRPSTTFWGNVYMAADDYWQILDESDATGGKYLRHNKNSDTATKNVHQVQHKFVLNENGDCNANYGGNMFPSIVLKKNTRYKISMRYRVSNLSENVELRIGYNHFEGPAANDFKYQKGKGNSNQLFTTRKNTNGWVTQDFIITTQENYYKTNGDILETPVSMAVYIDSISTTNWDYPSNATYTVDFDYINIDRISTVTVNFPEDETLNFTADGAIGDRIDFKVNETYQFYKAYDSKTGVFSEPISQSDKYFQNTDVTYYGKNVGFDIQDYKIDFSKYTPIMQSGGFWGNIYGAKDGNDQQFTDYLKQVKDSEATGGYYLSHKKNADVATGQNNSSFHQFILNEKGECNATSTEKDQSYPYIHLKNNTQYRISMRYRIADLSDGTKLRLAYNHLTGVAANEAQNVKELETFTSNTDGWVEKEYIITTPESYVKNAGEETARSLTIVVYPYSSTWDYDSKATYTVDFDYINIDRVSTVSVYNADESVDTPVKTLVGAPGELLNLEQANLRDYYLGYDSETNTLFDEIDGSTKTFVNLDEQKIYYAIHRSDYFTSLGFEKIDDNTVRFKAAYKECDADKIEVGGKAYTIEERGIAAKSHTNTEALEIGNDGIYIVKKENSFDDCFDYSNETKIRTFSARIENLDPELKISVRAFVKISGVYIYSDVMDYVISDVSNRLEGYKLVWGDEFDGSAVNTSKWEINRKDGIVSDQILASGDYRTVENGSLNLKVAKLSGNDGKNYACSIGATTRDKMSFKYGYLEMRAKFNYQTGIGNALWTKSIADEGDSMAEVDIAETMGSNNSFIPNLHVWKDSKGTQYNKDDSRCSKKKTFSDTEKNEYHIYGYEWTADYIRIYIDGELLQEYDLKTAYEDGIDMSCFQDPQFLILSSGVSVSGTNGYNSPDETTVFPSQADIDWIRLYQKSGSELNIQ